MEIRNVPLINDPPVFLSETEMLEFLSSLYKQFSGTDCTAITRMKGDASARSIYRIFSSEGKTVVGVYGPHPEENRAFRAFTQTFSQLALPVPVLLHTDRAGNGYLLEDLGDETLFLRVTKLRRENHGVFPIEQIASLYREAVEQLVRFQTEVDLEPLRQFCYQGDIFEQAAWHRDHLYFIDSFAGLLLPDQLDRDTLELELSNHRLLLSSYSRGYFLYRDFQSRNIMVTPNGLRFLDYQSGREGSPVYDIASLLFDARADLPEAFRRELQEQHCEIFSHRTGMKPDLLRDAFAPYALLRILQALGSYGNNGIRQRKPGYADSIPFGLRNALSVIQSDQRLQKFRCLRDTLTLIAEQKLWERHVQPA